MSHILDQLDCERTKEELRDLYLAYDQDKANAWRRLRAFANPDAVACLTQICNTGVPEMKRLCYMDEASLESKHLDEVVLDVQGILVNYSLPPVEDYTPIPKKNPGYARQEIIISGLGLDEFQVCEEAIKQIDRKFEASVKAGTYDRLMFSDVYGFSSISFANRYFTPVHVAQNALQVPFPCNVDPKGLLAKARGTKFVHIEENTVQYFARQQIFGNGKIVQEIKPVDPASFKIGQIVEAQVSFKLVPSMTGRRKLHITLRSVAILSDSKNLVGGHPLVTLPKPVRRPLKRCVGYEDTDEGRDVRRVRSRFADLMISEAFEVNDGPQTDE